MVMEQKRMLEEIQWRKEAEELAKKQREEEAARLKEREESDARRRRREEKRLYEEQQQKLAQEAEQRRVRAVKEEKERLKLQEQQNALYPSLMSSYPGHSHDHVNENYNKFAQKAKKDQEEMINRSNLDQRSSNSSESLSRTLPHKVPSYESDPVRPRSRHRGQSPIVTPSSESQESFVVHERHQKRSDAVEQKRPQRNVVEHPCRFTEEKSSEPDLMSFGFDHLHRVNGSQSVESQSTGLMSSFKNNVKNRSKKLFESAKLISNSRSKHLETFPDYVPENPNAVTRSRPTGSMQRSEFKNILHLSEGKSDTDGHKLKSKKPLHKEPWRN